MLQVVLGAPQRLLKEGRQSRKLVLVVVFVALLLDNMLLTVVGTFGALCAEGVSALSHSRQHVCWLIPSMGRDLLSFSSGKDMEVVKCWQEV